MSLHSIAGLGFSTMGMTCRPLDMFLFASELDRSQPSSRGVFHLGTAALIAAVIRGVTAINLKSPLGRILLVAALPASMFYGSDIAQLYFFTASLLI